VGLSGASFERERVPFKMDFLGNANSPGGSLRECERERGEYFKTHQGLRQGDPLCPLLFNLVVDILSCLLDKAVQKGHIVEILPNLIPGGISHIQYADDTIIMSDGLDTSILNLKLILYCFEWMSDLKINFQKSEVYAFGVPHQDKERMENMLNCKIGSWLMKYLGILVSNSRL
jgi:hypothetical protein